MDRKILHNTLRLGSFDILLRMDCQRYHDVIASMIPRLFRVKVKADIGRRKRITLDIIGTAKERNTFSSELERCDRYDILSRGLYRLIDYKKNRANIYVTTKKYSNYSYIYHCGFLAPLSFLLRKFDRTLIHAGLVEKAGRGLLIVGAKGAGKSSLSLAYLLKGYRCFSDEHPILSMESKKVKGYAFANLIGLPPQAARNFPEISKIMRWSPRRGKYFIDPFPLNRGPINRSCQIGVMVFPEFSARGPFLLKKLKKQDIIQRLLKDEYFHIFQKNLTGRQKGLWHLELMMQLAQTADAYQLKYGLKDLKKLPEIVQPL